MTLTLPRRRFFVTAGLGAAGALTLPMPFAAAPQTLTRDEAVMDHVAKEMARLYKLQRRQNLQAEHFQTMAANLRLLAMVYPDVRAEARKPRRPHDHQMRARQVEEVRKHLGVDISDEPEPAPLSAKDDARIREQLAREGMGPTLLKMADAAEAKASQMARSGKAAPYKNAQWYVMCDLRPAAETASVLVCSSLAASLGGGQAAVACYVSQIVVIVWRWAC